MEKRTEGSCSRCPFSFWVKTGSGHRFTGAGWIASKYLGGRDVQTKKGARHVNIEMRKTDDLIPYENNPRKNDGAVEAVANSIKEFGFKVPIIVDSEGVIVAGHTRLRAAQQLGLEEVPVVVADDLTEEQVKAFRIADNKTGDLALWDNDRLKEELRDILDFDMTDFGFGDFELTMLTEDLEPEGFSNEILEEYGGHGDEFLERDRVIITYRKDQLQELLEFMGLEELRKVVYDLDELK